MVLDWVEIGDEATMPVAVVGAGALGSLVAARLAAAGVSLVLIGRPSAHLDTMRRNGLLVRLPDGTEASVRVRATDDPAAVAEARLVLVAVKTWATGDALGPLRPWLAPATMILSLQNGLGNEERLRSAIGSATPIRIVLGVTEVGAMRGEPGAVLAAGDGPTTIGDPARPVDDDLRRIAGVLSTGGLPTLPVDDIECWIWRKAAVNAAINGLTALAGVANGAIVTDPDLRRAARRLAAEAGAVARALGFDVGDTGAAVEAVALATAGNHSSMWRDLRSGMPTEVEAIHGAVVAAGKRLGIPTPGNEVVAALLRGAVRRNVGLGLAPQRAGTTPMAAPPPSEAEATR